MRATRPRRVDLKREMSNTTRGCADQEEEDDCSGVNLAALDQYLQTPIGSPEARKWLDRAVGRRRH